MEKCIILKVFENGRSLMKDIIVQARSQSFAEADKIFRNHKDAVVEVYRHDDLSDEMMYTIRN